VAQARDQRQRHGVGNVGGDDARQRQVREDEQQHRHANRARAHRGEGDQQADDGAQQHRQAPVARGRGMGKLGAAACGLGGRALGREH